MEKGDPLEKGGRALGRVPKTRPLVLLRKMEAPRVVMRRIRTDALRNG